MEGIPSVRLAQLDSRDFNMLSATELQALEAELAWQIHTSAIRPFYAQEVRSASRPEKKE